jgi:predicted GNAT family N-acyltransferase
MSGTLAERDFEVRPVSSRGEIAELLQVREQVFCVEQGVPIRDERDGRDAEGLHLVAVSAGHVVATCRLIFSGDAVLLSRLAVDKAERRRGVAGAILDEADRISRARGQRRILLHAQTYVRELYEKHGYEPHGREFVDAGIEHIAMEKRL